MEDVQSVHTCGENILISFNYVARVVGYYQRYTKAKF